ncbi:TetR/AcrR family transcriptional regulator [Kribbella deserti]|uniref:TetR/AcrR family transcriptional regulator n=1 Tax=Kribbella deserti TaxID=1926257 RepID=A0ABV6QUQ5_9ACTN
MTVAKRGRPRSFDREAALEQAMRAFWRHGYDATSIADLTSAMSIGAPSLYAAFGDKRKLFEEVVEVYQRKYGIFSGRALAAEPTVREGAARMLREAAAEYTDPDHPYGCLVISAGQNCTPASADVEQMLRAIRTANIARLEELIEADIKAGLLPPETNARQLAVFIGATMQGMSQQARDGASRAELEAVAETAMLGWPSPH